MSAIAKPCDARMEKSETTDNEYFEALARLRMRKVTVTDESARKFKSADLPEISGNLSKKRFLFF